MKVFVHIDSFSTYIGNGGFVVLTSLANELGKMGMEVYLFDPLDKLTFKRLDWLSLPETHFKIARAEEVLKDNPKNYRLITAWLRTLPNRFRNESLRYLESSELLREGHESERAFLLRNKVKIANLHSHLNHYYNSLGFKDVINLDVWIRNDVKYRGFKLQNSVGIQLERRIDKVARALSKVGIKLHSWDNYAIFKKRSLIICNGKYKRVIEKMNLADFFIHNPYPSPHIKLFKGETFGLPLFEAMACGCVCIARRHEGIKFLEGTIPLVDTIYEANEKLIDLMNNEKEKEKIRFESLTFIEENYRFDSKRKEAIEKWLE